VRRAALRNSPQVRRSSAEDLFETVKGEVRLLSALNENHFEWTTRYSHVSQNRRDLGHPISY
jgi:hypothetical protein